MIEILADLEDCMRVIAAEDALSNLAECHRILDALDAERDTAPTQFRPNRPDQFSECNFVESRRISYASGFKFSVHEYLFENEDDSESCGSLNRSATTSNLTGTGNIEAPVTTTIHESPNRSKWVNDSPPVDFPRLGSSSLGNDHNRSGDLSDCEPAGRASYAEIQSRPSSCLSDTETDMRGLGSH